MNQNTLAYGNRIDDLGGVGNYSSEAAPSVVLSASLQTRGLTAALGAGAAPLVALLGSVCARDYNAAGFYSGRWRLAAARAPRAWQATPPAWWRRQRAAPRRVVALAPLATPCAPAWSALTSCRRGLGRAADLRASLARRS
ncbi:MAG: hypothetical protein Tsb0020_28160 [Haliangiales bacterium]